MKNIGLSEEFFGNSREFLNRSFDESSDNTPARTMDRIVAKGGSCQCVTCQNTGCNK